MGGDKAGKKGKCPKCGTMLTIPVASTIDDSPRPVAPPPPVAPVPGRSAAAMAPPPFDPTGGVAFVPGAPVAPPLRGQPVDEEYDDMPRRGRGGREDDDYDDEGDMPRRRSGSSWAMAKVGLLVNFIGFCVIAGGWLLLTIGYLLVSIVLIQLLTGTRDQPAGVHAGELVSIVLIQLLTGTFPSGGGGAGSLLSIGKILELIGVGAALAGWILCALSPPKAGARAMGIAAAAVTGGYLVLALVTIIVAASASARFGGGGGPVAGLSIGSTTGTLVLTLIMNVVFAASLVMGCLYIKAAATAIKKRWVADSATAPMVMACIFGGLQLMYHILGFIRGGPWQGWVALILIWAFVGVFITFLVQFILLVWRTRSVMR